MADDIDSREFDDSHPRDADRFEDGSDLSLSEEMPDWGGSELEAAYLKAMSALEASESSLPADPVPSSETPLRSSNEESSDRPESMAKVSTDMHGSSDVVSQIAYESPKPPGKPNANQSPADPINEKTSNASSMERPPTPQQIIEACLFVGGTALTASRLAGVLRGEFESEFVDRAIDDLNRLYAAENRPYEIRLGDGGYRLALREEYERIRHKAYGLGPKEVRLSQDALEVLAVVAYHQPIKQSRVEELGKPGCGAVLKQLVRRELLAIERDPERPRDVSYKTTGRFLSLFGIQNLDELPRHEQVAYK